MSSRLANDGVQKEDIPVLLTIFNRPDKIRAVMDSLRQIKPKRLFIAADGPRNDVQQDCEKCRLARQEATSVDWECDIKTRFLDENLGCDPAVSSALNWFFQQVEFGIIIEDDCLVHPHFFAFCGEILERYADDQRIMQISSLSPYTRRKHPYDYHFSRVFRPSGGWATWRRAWKYYTADISKYGDEEALTILKAYRPDHSKYQQHYRKFLDFKRGICNLWVAWDVQWNMACYAQNGLNIVPEKNLLHNIGFDEESTHTRSMNPVFENLQVQPLHFPLRHPPFVYADYRPERSLDRKIYRSLPMKGRCRYLFHKAWGTFSYIREVMPYGLD